MESKTSKTQLLRDVPYDLRIEIIENEFSKDFTESEKAQFAEKIKPYIKKHMEQGKRTDLIKSPPPSDVASTTSNSVGARNTDSNSSARPPNKHSKQNKPERVDDKIGEILNESGETVRKRAKVFENIDDDTKKQLDSKEKSLNSAYQKIIAKENTEKEIPPLPQGKFTEIVEDPGWDFGNKNIGGSGKSGAAFHYKTESTDKIARIPVQSIAANNAVLFMYTTNQHLITGSMLMSEYYKILNEHKLDALSKNTTNIDRINKMKEKMDEENEILSNVLKKTKVQSDAISVMHCHGFTPKCIVTWEKEGKAGWNGYWLNNVTEHMLIGIRGTVPAFGLTEKTIVKSKYVPRTHSKKPEEMWELIEKCIAKNKWKHRKIEFNCRTPRQGWTPHGDQISSEDMDKWEKLK